MKKATYYTDSGVKEQPLFVLKENKNGTVDLGLADETLVIGSCPVVAAGQNTVGHCVIEEAAGEEGGENDGKPQSPKPLDWMNKTELLAALAEFNAAAPDDKKLPLTEANTKAEIVAALKAAITPAAT